MSRCTAIGKQEGKSMKPERIELCQKFTPIQRLKGEVYQKVWIKRDDYTGIEFSGNKIRKLEYSIKEAQSLNANVLITCGGIQSNHARATVAAARKLGLKVHLVLRGEQPTSFIGNHFLDEIMDAEITYLNSDEFVHHNEYMYLLKTRYEKAGENAYIIPMGASNGIGNFGYANVYEEILEQEKALGICFDAIVCAVGSGGTFAGLNLGKIITRSNKAIIGFNISSTRQAFIDTTKLILKQSLKYLDSFESDEIINTLEYNIIDGYVGGGYAIADNLLLLNIKKLAREEGLILDPVYTGKAFFGMMDQMNKDLACYENILFIHTGGLYGLFPYESAFRALK